MLGFKSSDIAIYILLIDIEVVHMLKRSKSTKR